MERSPSGGDERSAESLQQTDEGMFRVLHVDDEPDFADMAATFIEREDERFAIETATSADEGLDSLRDDEFDCIISDHNMPGQSGIEFLEAVREDHPNLPFILYTGKGSEEVASDAISAGATDYLQKESGIGQYEVLANRINNAVSQARSRQAERHLHELAENTNDLLYIFNHDWSELVFINAAYEDIWGQPVEALRNDPTDFLNGIHPDDRDQVRKAMNRMSGGETVHIEYRVNPSEDFERWVSVRGEPIVDEAGNVVRVAGFATEIAERKHCERELQRHEALIETLPIGYVRTSFDDEFLDMNSTFVDMLGGNSPDEIQSHGVTEFYRDQATRDRLLDTLREEGQVNGEELKATTLSGDTIWIAITGRLIDDDTDPYVDALVQDITDRKQREYRLQRQLDQFEHFGSVLSHDLQTPLRTIEGRIELARETEEIEHLDQAKAAVERLDVLIDDLATVIREGELVDDVTTLDIEECVQDVWNALPTENATLQIRETVQIRGDENAVIRLLENFLKNALDHGGDTVTVEMLSDGFYLEDNGPGIPEDIRKEIFKMGYSGKGSDVGMGVGLASARQIALAHGWEISATKGSNGGARFEITDVEFNG